MKQSCLSILLIVIFYSGNLISQPIITQLTPVPTENTIYCTKKIPGTNTLISVGEGATVMRSFDEGETWNKQYSGIYLNPSLDLHDVYFLNSNVGFICGRAGYIFKTIDGGVVWCEVYDGNSDYKLFDVVFCNDSTGYCVGEYGQLNQTNNYGENWNNVQLGYYFDFNAIDFCDDNIGFIVGESAGVVLKTEDGGGAWNPVNLFPAYVNSGLKDIYFVNETVGYVIMHDLSGMTNSYGRIYKTNDKGNTCTEVFTITDFLPDAFDFVDENNGIVNFHGVGGDVKIFYTNDGGVNWYESEVPEEIWPLLNTVCYTSNDVAVSGGYMGQVYKTTDAGMAWEPKFERTFFGDISYMEFLNNSEGFILADNVLENNTNLYKTTDGGHTWDIISTVELESIDFVNSEIGYACSLENDLTVYKTVDGGCNWTETATVWSSAVSCSIKFYDEMSGLMSCVMGSILKTSDGGYIFAGHTESYSSREYDYWLVKVDENGNGEWNKTFGGADYEEAYSVQQTSDDGYIIAGKTKSFGEGGDDFWLVKTDEEGNREWSKTLGDFREDVANSVQQTSDGGYIVVGWTESQGAGKKDFWVVKLK